MSDLASRLVLTPSDLQAVPEHERELVLLTWLIKLPKTLAVTSRVRCCSLSFGFCFFVSISFLFLTQHTDMRVVHAHLSCIM